MFIFVLKTEDPSHNSGESESDHGCARGPPGLAGPPGPQVRLSSNITYIPELNPYSKSGTLLFFYHISFSLPQIRKKRLA